MKKIKVIDALFIISYIRSNYESVFNELVDKGFYECFIEWSNVQELDEDKQLIFDMSSGYFFTDKIFYNATLNRSFVQYETSIFCETLINIPEKIKDICNGFMKEEEVWFSWLSEKQYEKIKGYELKILSALTSQFAYYKVERGQSLLAEYFSCLNEMVKSGIITNLEPFKILSHYYGGGIHAVGSQCIMKLFYEKFCNDEQNRITAGLGNLNIETKFTRYTHSRLQQLSQVLFYKFPYQDIIGTVNRVTSDTFGNDIEDSLYKYVEHLSVYFEFDSQDELECIEQMIDECEESTKVMGYLEYPDVSKIFKQSRKSLEDLKYSRKIAEYIRTIKEKEAKMDIISLQKSDLDQSITLLNELIEERTKGNVKGDENYYILLNEFFDNLAGLESAINPNQIKALNDTIDLIILDIEITSFRLVVYNLDKKIRTQ